MGKAEKVLGKVFWGYVDPAQNLAKYKIK